MTRCNLELATPQFADTVASADQRRSELMLLLIQAGATAENAIVITKHPFMMPALDTGTYPLSKSDNAG